MVPSETGYVPGTRLREDLHHALEIFNVKPFAYDVLQYDELLDSADVGPTVWDRITVDIRSHADEYDAFVVLHGTDTMAYTASALEFSLAGLGRPVIVTGSVWPLVEPGKDGVDNLLATVAWILRGVGSGVWIVFGDRVLPGCRATKVSTKGRNAFDAPHLPPQFAHLPPLQVRQKLLAGAKTSGSLPPAGRFAAAKVALVKLYPGFNSANIDALVDVGIRGAVLELFGAGTGPTLDNHFRRSLLRAANAGLVLAATSQCMFGAVDLSQYGASRGLLDAGVISLKDMTSEAAFAKMCYLNGAELAGDDLRTELLTNYVGEVSVSLMPSIDEFC